MPSLKEIRTRIASIKSTRQITSAMKMVSASRLRKVQNNIVHLREYADTLKYVLGDVMLRLPPSYQNVFLKNRSNNHVLVVAIGSDKGLCGTYNSLLIKRTLKEVYALQDVGVRVSLLVFGKKPAKYFAKRGFSVLSDIDPHFDKVSYEYAVEFANLIASQYLKKNYERVLIVYNKFRNAVVHELTVEQLLPVKEEDLLDASDEEDRMDDPVILEPTPTEVIDYMTRQFLNYNTYRILLDASASEHGSRMTAMHKATDNADELLKSLTLSYNKARQASVTRELLDIVGGAER